MILYCFKYLCSHQSRLLILTVNSECQFGVSIRSVNAGQAAAVSICWNLIIGDVQVVLNDVKKIRLRQHRW